VRVLEGVPVLEGVRVGVLVGVTANCRAFDTDPSICVGTNISVYTIGANDSLYAIGMNESILAIDE
jgi:hypothetical protein